MSKVNFRTKMIGLIAIPFVLYCAASVYFPKYASDNLAKIKQQLYVTAYSASNEILNADRDLYQAFAAYQQLELGNLKGEEREAAIQAFEENVKQANDRVGNARHLMDDENMLDRKAEGTDKAASAMFTDFDEGINGWATEVRNAIKDGGRVNQHAGDLFDRGRDGVDVIGDILNQYSLDAIESMESDNKSNQNRIIISTIVLVAVLAVLLYVVTRRLSASVSRAANKTSRILQGDLTVQPETKYAGDEMGAILQSTDAMIGNLKSMIGGIIDNANKVSLSSVALHTASNETAASASHIAGHIQEVTAGTEVQARGAEETARAMEEMAIGITRIADNTTAMADLSAATSAGASEGRDSLDQLIDQMSGLGAVLSQLSQSIHMLENRSGMIGRIAEEITAFASQTNILSLNASIEAARAGEHGRGFAVVADEIRKLAAQSLGSADSIRELVAATQDDITGASGSMNRTLVEVEESGRRFEQLNGQFGRIAEAIQQMTEQLQENAAITEQLSASAEQVSASMEQSSQAASDNLGKIQSVAAATEEQLALMGSMEDSASQLKQIVQDLSRAVSYFKVK